MQPAQPPLPTAWNFPFQFASGIHASILISESLDGFSVAATLQNAGSCLKIAFCCAVTWPCAGSENSPATTDCANVIVVLSRGRDFKLSHAVTACACDVINRTANRSEEHTSELQSLAYLVCRLLLEKK